MIYTFTNKQLSHTIKLEDNQQIFINSIEFLEGDFGDEILHFYKKEKNNTGDKKKDIENFLTKVFEFSLGSYFSIYKNNEQIVYLIGDACEIFTENRCFECKIEVNKTGIFTFKADITVG